MRWIEVMAAFRPSARRGSSSLTSILFLVGNCKCLSFGWWIAVACTGFVYRTTSSSVEAFHLLRVDASAELRVGARTSSTRTLFASAPYVSSSSSSSSASSSSLDHGCCFDPELVRALDLGLVVQEVAAHCGTYRGRQELLRLAHLPQQKQQQQRSGLQAGPRRRQARLMQLVSEEDNGGDDDDDAEDTDDADTSSASSIHQQQQSTTNSKDNKRNRRKQRRAICSVATSAEEAQLERQRVGQALDALRGGDYPAALYPADARGGPLDVLTNPAVVTTDDDEWLRFSSLDFRTTDADYYYNGNDNDNDRNNGKKWTLEHILQAEQVVCKIILVHEWACSFQERKQRQESKERSSNLDAATATPFLLTGTIVKDVPVERLRQLQGDLENTVEVVRVRSVRDPTARSTFQFRLREAAFPVLGLLRERERNLIESQPPKQQQSKHQSPPPSSFSQQSKALADLRDEIRAKEADICHGLVRSIHAARRDIDDSLDMLAQLDVGLAKAAFGARLEAATITNTKDGAFSKTAAPAAGTIHVEKFVHPLLQLSSTKIRQKQLSSSTVDGTTTIVPVPIDLKLGEFEDDDDDDSIKDNSATPTKALIISGVNGGGKTLALKSFGLVCALSKLGIPIPGQSASVDHFDEIHTCVGDQQDLQRGESTFTAQLNRYSLLLDRVRRHPDRSHLVLLDELGGGTEENAGGAIGQAVLEQLLASSPRCRVVATTHSPRLKALSFHSDDIGCAAVLLQSSRRGVHDDGSSSHKQDRLPSYRLQYGCIGESHGMNAAARCNPPLPETVLERAATLLDDDDDDDNDTANLNGVDVSKNENSSSSRSDSNGSYMRALTASLERQLRVAEESVHAAKVREKDSASIQRAMMTLASAYDDHLAQLERRVEQCYQELQEQQQQSNEDEQQPLQLLGNTLAELRTARKQVKTEEDLLRERGLKRLRDYYSPQLGETVVVVDEDSEWNGTSGVVVSHELLSLEQRKRAFGNTVAVELGLWTGSSSSADLVGVPMPREVHVFQRYQLAVWDYESVWDDFDDSTKDGVVNLGKSSSKRKLGSLLSKLKTAESSSKATSQTKETVATTSSQSFTSSRERKAARRKKSKKR